MAEWTTEEIAIATGMKRAGFSAKKIGERLGRTACSVQAKTFKKGCKRHFGNNIGKIRSILL